MRKHFAWNPRLFLGTHDFLFWTHDFFLRTHDFFLGTHDFLPTTHDFLPTTHDFLPTTHDFLPTTHDFLPTTHDFLPTTHDPRLLASPVYNCLQLLFHLFANTYAISAHARSQIRFEKYQNLPKEAKLLFFFKRSQKELSSAEASVGYDYD